MAEQRPGTADPVVVGVDGSDAALVAVDVAAQEARSRDTTLLVVHAFIWPLMRVSLDPPPGAPPDAGLRHHAEQIVEEAVQRGRAAQPGLAVRGRVITGKAVDVLAGLAQTAALVVIADRGLGSVSGLVVGSVAVGLAAHASCPVLVVRGDAQGDGPVVVGVDGSPANDAAVRHAFATAARCGAPLLTVHARRHARGRDARRQEQDADAAEGLRDVSRAVEDERRRHPDVAVTSTVVDGDPRKALIAASRGARLVVVGSRGLGGFRGLLLGSVSHAVLHHAACPVLVVPHRDTPGAPLA